MPQFQDTKINEALGALDDLYKQMIEDAKIGDRAYNEGVIKMARKYKSNNLAINSSSLHSFSTKFDSTTKGGQHLKVQPTAVSRRKYKNGSRNPQDKKKKKSYRIAQYRIKENTMWQRLLNWDSLSRRSTKSR